MKNVLLRKYNFPTLLLIVSLPAILIYILWVTTVNVVTPIQITLTFVLGIIPWQAYLSWRRGPREKFPLFSMIAAMYFLFYAVPTFWGDPALSSQGGPDFEISPELVTAALLMAVGAVVALWLGMKVGFGRQHAPERINRLSLKPSRMNYIRFVLVAGCLLGFSDFSTYTFGPGGRQAMVILISTIPLLAFAILFRAYLREEATTLDRILIVGFLGLRFVGGMSSGWLGAFTSIIIICAALYISERRRLPRLAMLLVVGFTLFFQVGKEDFRDAYWIDREPPASRTERLMFWIDTSFEKWNDTIVNPSAEGLRETISPSVNRLSLLTQTGNVIDKTPRVVPYQYGKLYSYMFITLIPRFVWPDKPSVNEANRYYQVAYGLTREENLDGVSIAVGVLTEGFINFGWIGALGVMFLLGVFFDFFQAVCFSKSSGVLWTSLGMVLLPQLLGIESQMAQYLGGILQQVVLTILVMIPALKFTRSSVKLRNVSLGYAGKQS
jgi:hypothetical protein